MLQRALARSLHAAAPSLTRVLARGPPRAAAAPLELCGHTDVVLSSLTLDGAAVVGYERTAKGGLVIHAPAGGCVLARGGRQLCVS